MRRTPKYRWIHPAVVSRFRLIGYENRAMKQDFVTITVDAGEVGAAQCHGAL